MGAFDDLIPTSKPGAVLPSEPNRGYFGDLIPEKQPEPETVGQVRGFFGALERGVKQVQALPETIALANRSGLDDSGIAQYRAHRIGQLTGESGPEAIYRTQLDAAKKLAESQADIASVPRSEAQQRLDRAEGWRQKFSAWLRDPVELTASIAAESLPASVAGATGGALVGGPVGMVAGVGLSSGLMTFSSELLGNAANRGVDLKNPEAIGEWLRSDAYQKDADAALTKAVTVGAIDAGTAGMAGRFVVPAIRTGLMRNIAVASGKELGLQAVAGAGGEALGSVAAGQKIDPFNVFAEAIAEVGSGPAEVAGNFRSRSKGIRSRYRAPEVPRSEPILQPINEPQERPAVQVPVQPVSTVAASQAVEATPVVREEAPIGGEIIERPKEERREELLTPPGAASVAPVSKEPWQMTKSEWSKWADPSIAITPSFHETIVAEALRDGKPVPQEVLADYPDLANAPQTPISRPTGGTADRPVQAAVERGVELPKVGDTIEFQEGFPNPKTIRAKVVRLAKNPVPGGEPIIPIVERQGTEQPAVEWFETGKVVPSDVRAVPVEEGKPWFVPWADGRAAAWFKTKESADEFYRQKLAENDVDGPPQLGNPPVGVKYADDKYQVSVKGQQESGAATGEVPDKTTPPSAPSSQSRDALILEEAKRAIQANEERLKEIAKQRKEVRAEFKGVKPISTMNRTTPRIERGQQFQRALDNLEFEESGVARQLAADRKKLEELQANRPSPTKSEPVSSKSVVPSTFQKGERVITSDYGPGVVESVLPNRIRVLPDSGGKAIGVNPKRVRKAEEQPAQRASHANPKLSGIPTKTGGTQQGSEGTRQPDAESPRVVPARGERVGGAVAPLQEMQQANVAITPEKEAFYRGLLNQNVNDGGRQSTVFTYMVEEGVPFKDALRLTQEYHPNFGTPEANAALAARAKQTAPERVKIGKSPQPYTVLERLPASEVERQNGEQPVRVRNEKTGEESVVLENQLTAIAEKAQKAATPSTAQAKMQAEVSETAVEVQQAKPQPPVAQQTKPPGALEPRAQKKFLIEEVDKALSEAPDEATRKPTGADADLEQLMAARKAATPREYGPVDEDLAALRADELFTKYNIPTEHARYEGYVNMLGGRQDARPAYHIKAGDRLKMLEEAIQAVRWKALDKVVIDVPGDGTFEVINSKAALKEFKERAKKFPVKATTRTEPSRPRTEAATPPKVETKRTFTGDVKTAYEFATTDESRYVLHSVYSDGKRLVATNGRHIIVIDSKGPGTPSKPVLLQENGQPKTDWGTDAKTGKKNPAPTYPDYKQVIPPDESVKSLYKGVDTARLFTLLKQAMAVKDMERDATVYLHVDDQGRVGVTSKDPNFGEYATGVTPDSKRVIAVNGNYLLQAITAARRLGSEKVDFKYTDELSPMVVEGKGWKYVLMPMRLSSNTRFRQSNEVSPQTKEVPEAGQRTQVPGASVAEGSARGNEVLRPDDSQSDTTARSSSEGRIRGRDEAVSSVSGGVPASGEQGGGNLSSGTRFFPEGTPANATPQLKRAIEFLASRFDPDRPSPVSTSQTQSFNRRLLSKLNGLTVRFRNEGEGADARYQSNNGRDEIILNADQLIHFDPAQEVNVAYWDAVFAEELIHAASMRVASQEEMVSVWRSLTADEQDKVIEAYGKPRDDLSDYQWGAEYVRMVLQERLTGETSEKRGFFWRQTEALKEHLRNLVNFLKKAFGLKPENDIARKLIDGIEAIIRDEAPVNQNILRESSELFSGGEKPIADILQRGDIEDAGGEYIPTEVFGIRDKVLDKTQYTEEKRETALGVAKSVFDEAGLTTTRDGDGHFQLTNTGNKDNAAGQKLVDATRKEIAKYGQGALELTELVQSLVLDFKNGRMDALFDKPIRNQLYSLAQGERSFRGVSLNALRGAGEDIKFIAQNIDVYLQRVWHEAFGGEQIERVITKVRDNLRAFFTPEVIKEIVEANPALAKVEGAEKIVADGLATDFANLNMLRDTYADSLQKAGVPEKEAMVLAKQIIEALKPRIRLAAADATKKVEDSLTADEKTAVKGKKPIWQRIVDAVTRGEFDSSQALRDKARENGWKPPSDEDVARIKRLAERERELHQLTQKEVEAAGGNQDKLRREQILRDESTLPRRLPLMRQMEAEWSAITRPVNFGRGLWRNRANNAAFLNELVSANLLLRLSFAPKQALSVLSQFLVHVPTRAVAQAIELHSQSKSLEQDTALRKDIYNSLTGAYQSSLAGFKDGMAQFIAAGKGRGEARNVDRLMSGISAIERIDAQAKAYAEQGKTGMAILFRMLSFIRLGYRIAQAFDNLHGVPSEYVEIRHQAVRELMKNGIERAAANAQADNIIESIKKNHINATVQAKAFLDAQGQKYTSEQLREISYRIARRWAYEDMRALGLPADDFLAENRGLRETIGWNEREAGTASIGGAVGEIVSKTGKVGEKIGLPLALGRFGNAIAISINRALHFTPLGFFPGAFGDNNAWFKSELDRNQRKVEASVGTMLGSIAFMLALSGVFVVRLRWPKDKEERDLFEAQGHRPGTIEIPNGDGTFSAISMNTGLASFLAPYLAAGGALRDLLTEREGQQAKLNAEAAKKGLPAEQIRPMSFADMVGVAAQSAYQTVLGGRTAAGAVASIADYGIPNVTKVAASQTAPLIPGLPALQEISRMGGVVLDSKLATFTDFLLPLPTSKARRVNFLGEPAGTPDDIQRIVQVLTGGSYPNVDPKQAEAQRAYSILFNTDFKPGSINPNKGYAIGSSFRPFNDSELENYTALRGQEFKQALGQLPENADIKTVRAAFRSANQRALGKMGVNAFARKTKTRRSRGLRSRGIRSLRSRRKGIRSLRSSARYSF